MEQWKTGPVGQLERELGVKFRKKSELRLMRAVAWFLNRLPDLKRLTLDGATEVVRRGDRFMADFVTTYRLPFQKIPWIAHPDEWDVIEWRYRGLWAHEKIHADDMGSSWGLFKMFWLLWLLPLPVVLSGRWYIERWAFLGDIQRGRLTPRQGAELLWGDYLWAWPKTWAVRWWRAQLTREEDF